VQRDVTVKCDADCSQRGAAHVKNERSLTYKVKVKVKVKFALEQVTKAQRGCRVIAVLFL